MRRAEDDWPPSGLEGGRSRSRNIQPVQIVRTPQHAVRQESYQQQQRGSYPVYETPSYENDDGDYYSRYKLTIPRISESYGIPNLQHVTVHFKVTHSFSHLKCPKND